MVILNALVSFAQNYKVEKLMMAFLDYIPKSVNVLRDGEVETLDAKDILLVQEGDKISADGVVIEAAQLLVDESVLTGESVAAEKLACEETIEESALVFSGTMVVKGSARIIVIRTGRQSEIGKISEMSQTVRSDLTPMQKELKNFVQKITWLALGIGLVFFVTGFLIGNSFWTNLVFAIGIIVANVPEGLLPTVTLALTQASGAFLVAIIFSQVGNVPAFHHFFTTAPIPLAVWLAMLLAPIIVFFIEEGRKWLVRRGVDVLAA